MSVLPFPMAMSLPPYPDDPAVSDLIWCVAVMDGRDPDLIPAFEILARQAAYGGRYGIVSDKEWGFARQLARRLRAKHGYQPKPIHELSELSIACHVFLSANADDSGVHKASVGALAKALGASEHRTRRALWALHHAWIVDIHPWVEGRANMGWAVHVHAGTGEGVACAG